jgi:hypothetical protein
MTPKNFARNNASSLRIQGELYGSSGSRTNFALDSAYVHLTSGDGFGIRIDAPEASALNEVLIFLDLVTGTPASTTMRARVYTGSTIAAQPGSTLQATATTITYPTVSDRWMRIQFGTPYTPAKGETIWVIIDNNSASPTVNFPNVLTATNTAVSQNQSYIAYTSTAGFSAAGIQVAESILMFQMGSTWYGNPITATASSFTSNQLKRGIVVEPQTNVLINAIQYPASTAINNLEIFESTQLPNATPIHTLTPSALQELQGVYTPTTDIVLYRGKKYYVVLDYATNQTAPSGGDIEDYATYSTVFDSIVNNYGYCAGVQEQAGNTWTEFNDIIPAITIHIKELQVPTVTSAG